MARLVLPHSASQPTPQQPFLGSLVSALYCSLGCWAAPRGLARSHWHHCPHLPGPPSGRSGKWVLSKLGQLRSRSLEHGVEALSSA